MQQVWDWLERLGMSEYAERFAEHRIDFSVLPELTDQDLKDRGRRAGTGRSVDQDRRSVDARDRDWRTLERRFPPSRSRRHSSQARSGQRPAGSGSIFRCHCVAQQQKARSFELRAALSLAKLYQSTGRAADAHAVLAPALEGFSPTPEFPEIAEARGVLAALIKGGKAC
jgi:SAM domain (Sterile alpha motif)